MNPIPEKMISGIFDQLALEQNDKGNVTNERLAYESVHDLAMHLHTMRGLRMKIAEEGYKIHRAR